MLNYDLKNSNIIFHIYTYSNCDGGTFTALSTQDGSGSTPGDTAPVKDKGCGSTVGGAIVLITLIAGAALLKKKD